jgi:hypothetical protein
MWKRRIWGLAAAGASAWLFACGGKTTKAKPVRYEVLGSWFHSYGPYSRGRCYPVGHFAREFTGNYWMVVQKEKHGAFEAVDDGKCTLQLKQDQTGVLVGDGASCSIAVDGPLASYGIKSRRYSRFRLDPKNGYFGATFVDDAEPNPRDHSVACGLIEGRIWASER